MVRLESGDQCLYFTESWKLGWEDAHRYCQSIGGELASTDSLIDLPKMLPLSGLVQNFDIISSCFNRLNIIKNQISLHKNNR